MGLTDNKFIFIFLPITVILNLVLPQRLKNYAVFLFSVLFYYLATGKSISFTILILALMLANWLFGLLISISEYKKTCLFLGVLVNAMLLLIYRLAASKILPAGVWAASIGISYISFRNIGYLHEVYKGQNPEKNLVSFGAFDMLFPRIIQGPLQTYAELCEALHSRKPKFKDIGYGIELFILGFGMKMLIAQKITTIYSSPAIFGFESVSTPMAWICVLTYSVCLFADFFGYSLMSDGIAVMLGFPRCINFDEPYSSRSVSEFWNRWHMSLGRWFKENVYFPLGGSRHGMFRTFLSIFAVWMLTGLWHGFGISFILWGLISFLFVFAEKISAKHNGLIKKITANRVLSRIYLLIYVAISWSLFMCPDFSQFTELVKRLFPFFGSADYIDNLDFLTYGTKYIFLLVGIFICTPYASLLWNKIRKHRALAAVLLYIIFWCSVYVSSVMGSNPFMYADF